MSKYVELTKENFKDKVSTGVALVDFWASWCGPCRMIAPVIEELAVEFDGTAIVAKVNTDEQQELAAEFGIRSIPCVLIFKDGVKVQEMVGANSKDFYAKAINDHL